jgi:hypothetical protein
MTQNPPPAQPAYYGAPQQPKRKSKGTAIVLGIVLGLLSLCCVLGVINLATGGSKSAPTIVVTDNGTAGAVGAATWRAVEPVKSAASSKPAATKAPAPVFTSGSYEIGKSNNPDGGTIKPGTYKVTTPDHCYWERVKSFDGEFGSIIANGNIEAGETVRVTIKRTDKGLNMTDDCVLK